MTSSRATADTFAAMILTHGRADNVITLRTLRRQGYTGRVVLVVDDSDRQLEQYRTLAETVPGVDLAVFSKADVAATFDEADTNPDRRTIVYARNACFPIARDLGLDYFVELDDDYTDFLFRYVRDDGVVKGRLCRDLDAVFTIMLDFLDDTGAACVALSQGGDHMGGAAATVLKGLRRKAMNSLFHRTDRPVTYLGRVNEDVNTYVLQGGRGDLFLTVMGLQLNQAQTQAQAGGMTDSYLASGTYVKSFYTVMLAPSAARIGTLGRDSHRFHHAIAWDRAVPKVLSDVHRKPRPARVRRGQSSRSGK